MIKVYEKPELMITELSNNDIITVSGLTFGGDKGTSNRESFGSLFGGE
ncbi:MAG: hypothetical protein IJS61_00915 [Firmicutes bacterium]|nr:hypothetical protein [Bacillota bacterium]